MKKILILGGAKAQVPLIEAAKKEGYYVVLCDWTTTNPGIALADKHYQVSTLDLDAVLSVAEKENVDGVISNSEPAMMNVASVSEKLHLIGNPVKSIEQLISKNEFRKLQEKCGVFCPKHYVVATKDELYHAVEQISTPFIVKPCMSSATRGTQKFERKDFPSIELAFDECAKYSMNNCVCVEEFVEMPSLVLCDGDIFVYEDEILWDGLFLSTRSSFAPMVPTTQTFPIQIENDKLDSLKDAIKKLITGAGIRFGEYNIELYFTRENEPFVIEINARQGGNGIPKRIFEHCGIDMYKLLVTSAMGDLSYFYSLKTVERSCNYICRHPVYSKKIGRYCGIHISDEIGRYVTDIEEVKTVGDAVLIGNDATTVVAFVNLSFPTQAEQMAWFDKLETVIFPVVD